AALALHTGVKPPTLHLTRPNPAWNPDTSPFAFHTSAQPWAAPAPGGRAGGVAAVSRSGSGGPSAHVVLAAHPPTADPRHARHEWPVELFLFRGTTAEAVHRGVRKLLDRLPGTSASLRALGASA